MNILKLFEDGKIALIERNTAIQPYVVVSNFDKKEELWSSGIYFDDKHKAELCYEELILCREYDSCKTDDEKYDCIVRKMNLEIKIQLSKCELKVNSIGLYHLGRLFHAKNEVERYLADHETISDDLWEFFECDYPLSELIDRLEGSYDDLDEAYLMELEDIANYEDE